MTDILHNIEHEISLVRMGLRRDLGNPRWDVQREALRSARAEFNQIIVDALCDRVTIAEEEPWLLDRLDEIVADAQRSIDWCERRLRDEGASDA